VPLVVCALAGLLGCGGSGESDSTGAQSSREPVKVGSSKKSRIKVDTTHRRDATTPDASNREAGNKLQREQRDKSTPKPRKLSAKPRPDGCPGQLSARQCADLRDAAAQPASAPDTRTSENGCPVGMSRELCKVAAQAQEGTEGSESQTKPSGCPDSLTPAQCAKVAETIEEATK
jgi:hypothetical protein